MLLQCLLNFALIGLTVSHNRHCHDLLGPGCLILIQSSFTGTILVIPPVISQVYLSKFLLRCLLVTNIFCDSLEASYTIAWLMAL